MACLASALAMATESVALHPVADTTLFESDPNNNLGATPTFVSGTTSGNLGQPFRSRAMMTFDVAGKVPSGATIASAELTLTVVRIPGPAVNSNFDLHRLLEPWGEGNKNSTTGLQATTGESTWISRFFLLPQWAAPGGAPGTDFLTAVSASTFVQGLGEYTFAATSNLTADVQFWLDNTNANFGWILLSQAEATASTARRFASREAATGAPVLVVNYLLPPLVTNLTRQDSNLTFQFNVEAGYDYAVEYADAIPATNWLTLTNFGAKLAGFEATVTNSLDAAPSRFYRLSRVPCGCR